MKLYVLEWSTHCIVDGDTVVLCGVFTSREKAEAAKAAINADPNYKLPGFGTEGDYRYFDITEVEADTITLCTWN